MIKKLTLNAALSAAASGSAPNVIEYQKGIRRIVIGSPIYTIHSISIMQLHIPSFYKEGTLGKPPSGRTNKQHNLIMNMNKKGRYN